MIANVVGVVVGVVLDTRVAPCTLIVGPAAAGAAEAEEIDGGTTCGIGNWLVALWAEAGPADARANRPTTTNRVVNRFALVSGPKPLFTLPSKILTVVIVPVL